MPVVQKIERKGWPGAPYVGEGGYTRGRLKDRGAGGWARRVPKAGRSFSVWRVRRTERGTDDGWDLRYGDKDKRKVEGQGVCVCADGWDGLDGVVVLVCGPLDGWQARQDNTTRTQARTAPLPSPPPVRTSFVHVPIGQASRQPFCPPPPGPRVRCQGRRRLAARGVRSARVCEAIDAPSAYGLSTWLSGRRGTRSPGSSVAVPRRPNQAPKHQALLRMATQQ